MGENGTPSPTFGELNSSPGEVFHVRVFPSRNTANRALEETWRNAIWSIIPHSVQMQACLLNVESGVTLTEPITLADQ